MILAVLSISLTTQPIGTPQFDLFEANFLSSVRRRSTDCEYWVNSGIVLLSIWQVARANDWSILIYNKIVDVMINFLNISIWLVYYPIFYLHQEFHLWFSSLPVWILVSHWDLLRNSCMTLFFIDTYGYYSNQPDYPSLVVLLEVSLLEHASYLRVRQNLLNQIHWQE